MPSKQTKRSKSNSTFNKKSPKLAFSRFSRVQKLLAGSFVLMFAAVGVSFVFRSYAASTPPRNLWYHKDTFIGKAADGISGQVDCQSVTGDTGYGPLASCLQQKPGSGVGSVPLAYRTGLYSPVTRVFNQSGGWVAHTNGSRDFYCKNMDNFFGGSAPIMSGYGPTSYGQIYRYYGGKWQIKWASMNLINGNCSPSGNWMTAKAW